MPVVLRSTPIRAATIPLFLLAATLAATAPARAAPDPIPAASHTVQWSGAPTAAAPGGAVPGGPTGAAPRGTTLAQVSPLNAGPLQGPLASGTGSGAAPRCGCPPVRHVVHRRRVARTPPLPVRVAAVPVAPVYAYPPVVYRPVVPVYAYRPVYPVYRPIYPYAYRPYFVRPYFFRGGYY